MATIGSLLLTISQAYHKFNPQHDIDFIVRANVNSTKEQKETFPAYGQPTTWNDTLELTVSSTDTISLTLQTASSTTTNISASGVLSLSNYIPLHTSTTWSSPDITTDLSNNGTLIATLRLQLKYTPTGTAPYSSSSIEKGSDEPPSYGFHSSNPNDMLYQNGLGITTQESPYTAKYPSSSMNSNQFNTSTGYSSLNMGDAGSNTYPSYSSYQYNTSPCNTPDDSVNTHLLGINADGNDTPLPASRNTPLSDAHSDSGDKKKISVNHYKGIYFSLISNAIVYIFHILFFVPVLYDIRTRYDDFPGCASMKTRIDFIAATPIYGGIATVILLCVCYQIYRISQQRYLYKDHEQHSGMINSYTHIIISIAPMIFASHHLHTLTNIPRNQCIGKVQRGFTYTFLFLTFLNFLGVCMVAALTSMGKRNNQYFSYLLIYGLFLFLLLGLLLITDGVILELVADILTHIFK